MFLFLLSHAYYACIHETEAVWRLLVNNNSKIVITKGYKNIFIATRVEATCKGMEMTELSTEIFPYSWLMINVALKYLFGTYHTLAGQ